MTKPHTLKQLSWRAAAKNYDTSKKLTTTQVDNLLEALSLSPSAFGLQPYKFYVVSDDKIKAAISEVGYHQPQMTQASHLIVFASALKVTTDDVEAYAANIAKTRGIPEKAVADYKASMMHFVTSHDETFLANWAARQVYIPLGVLVTVAAAEQIDSSPMEGFDTKGVDEILGITKDGFASRAMVAVGYRSADDAYSKMAKVRKPLAQIIKKV